MANPLVLIDSNLIVYALNQSSPKRAVAQQFLKDHQRHLAIAHQNILESLRVLTHAKFPHPMPVPAALQAVRGITDVCHVVAPEQAAHHVALALMDKYQLEGDKVFDAYLAATALAADIHTIATDNTKDFARFEDIVLINPFT